MMQWMGDEDVKVLLAQSAAAAAAASQKGEKKVIELDPIAQSDAISFSSIS